MTKNKYCAKIFRKFNILITKRNFTTTTALSKARLNLSKNTAYIKGVLDKSGVSGIQQIWPWWVLKYFLADQTHAKINDL